MINEKFGRWTVVADSSSKFYGRHERRYWLCRCQCGTVRAVLENTLRSGRSTSCGCFTRERSSEVNTKHGASKTYTPEYEAWGAMLDRCRNPNNPRFAKYGGRGIGVCERWKDYEAFLEDMGCRPTPEHSLDRIDNDGNYEPSNCRWAMPHQQMVNRSVTRFVDVDGKKVPLADLAKTSGISANTLRFRILKKWDLHRALTQPVRPKRTKAGTY